jgi:hypothetical protein
MLKILTTVFLILIHLKFCIPNQKLSIIFDKIIDNRLPITVRFAYLCFCISSYNGEFEFFSFDVFSKNAAEQAFTEKFTTKSSVNHLPVCKQFYKI